MSPSIATALMVWLVSSTHIGAPDIYVYRQSESVCQVTLTENGGDRYSFEEGNFAEPTSPEQACDYAAQGALDMWVLYHGQY